MGKIIGDPKKEVVFKQTDRLDMDFSNPKPEIITLPEFEERLIETPSLGFNSFQRLYAALRMFGMEETSHYKRWRFLDDPINTPGAPAGDLAVFGVESIAEAFMDYLGGATVNKNDQERCFLMTGPTGSSKTTLVKLMAKCLDAFGETDEGAVYTVEFDMESSQKTLDLFHGLKKIVCPTHENPLKFIHPKKLVSMLEQANSGVGMPWQTLYPNTSNCPACTYVLQVLSANDIDPSEVMKVRRLFSEVAGTDMHSVALAEHRPTHEKGYDPAKFFGGGINFQRMKALVAKDHPLVNEYGLAGAHDGPSAQRHIIHFSEMLKYNHDCLHELLDTFQERKLVIAGRSVELDAVIIATSNLEDVKEKGEDASMAEYLWSRTRPKLVPHLTVRRDLTRALEKRVYTPRAMRGTHVPPHFVDCVMSSLGVLAAIEEPESLAFDVLTKMAILNHENVPGLEGNVANIRKQLVREATKKPISEVVEGVQMGITFKMFQDSVGEYIGALSRVQIQPELRDERYENCLAHHAELPRVLEDLLNTYEAINPETREIAIDQIKTVFTLWQRKMADDVNIAVLGKGMLTNTAAKYLATVFALARKENSYLDPETMQTQTIDKGFIKKMDDLSRTSNPEAFRQLYASMVRFRVGIDEGPKDVKELADILLKDDDTFRAVVQKYVTEAILPRSVDSVSTAYSPDNKGLITTLTSGGELLGLKPDQHYCKACANLAISAASKIRKLGDDDDDFAGVYDFNCGGCSGCN